MEAASVYGAYVLTYAFARKEDQPIRLCLRNRCLQACPSAPLATYRQPTPNPQYVRYKRWRTITVRPFPHPRRPLSSTKLHGPTAMMISNAVIDGQLRNAIISLAHASIPLLTSNLHPQYDPHARLLPDLLDSFRTRHQWSCTVRFYGEVIYFYAIIGHLNSLLHSDTR